jgi:hypothetical protein
MKHDLLHAIASLVDEALEYAERNPLRSPFEGCETIEILKIVYKNANLKINEVVEEYSRLFGAPPKSNVEKIIRRSGVYEFASRRKAIEKLNTAEDTLFELLFALHHDPIELITKLQQAISPRYANSKFVSHLLLFKLSIIVRKTAESDWNTLSLKIEKLLNITLPTRSRDLMRKIVDAVQEAYGITTSHSMKERIEEVIASVDQIRVEDYESLEELNAELRASLFGLRRELVELQTELSNRTEMSRDDTLHELLVEMNTDSNGRLLDMVMRTGHQVEELFTQGWQPEAAIENLPYSIKMLKDFFENIGVSPIREPGQQEYIDIGALEYIDYQGSEFSDENDRKLVEYRTSGWQRAGRVIARPLAIEIRQPTAPEMFIWEQDSERPAASEA